MKEKKVDRRVIYTKMVIKESFIKLLQQKPISKITIKEICEVADINRATFYSHYTDQYDLFQQIETGIIDEINHYISSYNLTDPSDAPIEMIIKILEFVKNNSEIFNLLLNNGDIRFQKEITNIIGQQHFIPMNLDKESTREDEYIFLFFANGCIGIIKKWLMDGMEKPIREIAELMLKLAIYGRSGVD
ncbi:TetR/AcrR family transcriptional regulator [Anaeromicropila herbilytica]|uniref:TetR family transcriptional regulator n=1 Tax=Anaeromicropila herbilytica TaxID=2785025 RepID=A0A7R7EKW7_9FIRM|nr:TetR/AcrR family transcriptional regulator [Anaeromicropila herbilytica]BCN30776.1 TetR family transcriptional regulator [Anaeromicropila herbilytica]